MLEVLFSAGVSSRSLRVLRMMGAVTGDSVEAIGCGSISLDDTCVSVSNPETSGEASVCGSILPRDRR